MLKGSSAAPSQPGPGAMQPAAAGLPAPQGCAVTSRPRYRYRTTQPTPPSQGRPVIGSGARVILLPPSLKSL